MDKDIEVAEGEEVLGYENMSMTEALKTIMLGKVVAVPATKDPGAAVVKMEVQEKDIPSGFEIVGDVAHMNFS